MTIRGGGHPILDMASVPRFRMGPPPWSFAADAYDCIKVQLATELTGYKFVARCSRLYGELPSDGLAGCGKSRDFGKTVMKRARNGNPGLIKSTGYEGAKGDESGWKHHR